jgi:hypothetical protein
MQLYCLTPQKGPSFLFNQADMVEARRFLNSASPKGFLHQHGVDPDHSSPLLQANAEQTELWRLSLQRAVRRGVFAGGWNPRAYVHIALFRQ